MHITIPSSSCSGKESYTKFLFIPTGCTDNSYAQMKGLPNTPLLTKRSCDDYCSPKKHPKQDAVKSHSLLQKKDLRSRQIPPSSPCMTTCVSNLFQICTERKEEDEFHIQEVSA